jgi:serine phosphatase RsbU (regulator of sigma subunit)/tetratricopeptide (TPR) repeat protein
MPYIRSENPFLFMNRRIFHFIGIAVLLCLLSFSAQSQTKVIDSLLNEVSTLSRSLADVTRDTSMINAYYSLADEFFEKDDQGKEQYYTNLALDLIAPMLEKVQAGTKLSEWLIHQQGIGFGNRGSYYQDIGDLSKALDNHLKALRNDEKINNIAGIERHLCNLAIVYGDLGDHQKSLDYYFAALKYAKLANIRSSEANLYGNIATAYYYMNENEKALMYERKSMDMFKALRDTAGIIFVLGNIGVTYKDIGQDKMDAGKDPSEIPEFYTAVVYYKKALEMLGPNGNKSSRAIDMGSLGSVYTSLGKYEEAEKYLKESIRLSHEINDLYGIMEISESLSELYHKMAQDKGLHPAKRAEYLSMAYAKMLEHNTAKDSIFDKDKTSDITRKEMNYEYEKKEAIVKATQEAEKRTQRIIVGSVIFGLLLSLTFLIFIFRSLRTTKKQKQVIELQKQKVEEHRKGIIDSITYARRIQEALLKDEEHVTTHLPEHFVLYKPKDIVSGDFYWSAEKKGYWYICVADCTGHGVPGAFMSMLGIAYLNEINAGEEVLTPGQILDSLREKIVKELKQKGESGESHDGMDISMMRYNFRTREMIWAGANNALWISTKENDKKVIKETEPDKQPIGYTFDPIPFTDHHFILNQKDTVYLFSDGYADQFGGPKGKKFKSKQLQEKLLEISNEPLSRQKEILDSIFESWRGDLEQLDDVAIIGVRI